MKIRMLVTRGSYQQGHVYDVSEAEAAGMLHMKECERAAPVRESTAVTPAETATKPAAKARKATRPPKG